MHVSKPMECMTPRVNLNNVNYGLSGIMMCQCRFIDFNTRTTLVGNVDNKGGWLYMDGAKGYGRKVCAFLSVVL